MSFAAQDLSALKALLKSAIVEVLEERGDLIQELLVDALEDIGLANAISEGDGTANVSREGILEIIAQGSQRSSASSLCALCGDSPPHPAI